MCDEKNHRTGERPGLCKQRLRLRGPPEVRVWKAKPRGVSGGRGGQGQCHCSCRDGAEEKAGDAPALLTSACELRILGEDGCERFGDRDTGHRSVVIIASTCTRRWLL